MQNAESMQVDRAGFLALTAALAGGGVVGYLVADRQHAKTAAVGDSKPPVADGRVPTEEEKRATAELNAKGNEAKAKEAKEAKAAAAPKCDDSIGAAADCPAAPDSTAEGMCGDALHWASKRCADFKAAFKPKVAEAAVACLKSLKGIEQCDAARVNLCGHQALMTACQEIAPDDFLGATSTAPLSRPSDAEPLTGVAAQCDAIVKSCGATAPATSYVDCVRTLSGMSEAGRTSASACMKLHCGDKGFLGCEAAPPNLTTVPPAIQ